VRRIRRVRYRGQVEEERQAAAEAADIEAADREAGESRHPAEHRRGPAEDGSDTQQ
jgi:hypothetical protein